MNKRGSALLIVLGMLSFMIVSAVSFSIFMRQGRAPSSYYRKSVADRHLLNAALARAIDEIDTAIGNDPFPGVGDNASRGLDSSDKWIGRVLAPYANESDIEADLAATEIEDKEIWNTTVSTLTAEGLGYLPPCLVNEVRLFSRLSTNAYWKSFNYDQGRYAFTAVNVSDFFDINRLPKNPNRSSSPDGRVSLATLFTDSPTSVEPNKNQVEGFYKAMSERNIEYPTIPLVSLLDYNLSIGKLSGSGFRSPFFEFFNNNGASGMYGNLLDTEISRQAFVVDSYMMETNTAGNYVDLTKPDNQPFYGTPNFPGPEVGSQLTIQDVFDSNNQFFWKKRSDFVINGEATEIEDNFPILTQILLADYLDHDHIPLSLNLPCTEIAPMLVGIECDPKVKVSFKHPVVPQGHYDSNGNLSYYNAKFQMDISANPEFTFQFAFPFRSVADRLINADGKYKVQVVARLFFTSNNDDTLRMPRTAGYNVDFLSDAHANGPQDNASGYQWPTSDQDNQYSIHWGSKEVDITVPDQNVLTETDYIITIPVQMRQKGGTFDLFDAWYTGGYSALVPKNTPYYDNAGTLVGNTPYDVAFPQNSHASPFFRFLEYNNGSLSALTAFNSNIKIRPTLAVWVRIVDPTDNNKVVDMVPATVKCDMWNNGNLNIRSVFDQYEAYEGPTYSDWQVPFIRFFGDASTEFLLDLQGIGSRIGPSGQPGQSLNFGSATAEQKAYLAGDPRYNWAPEDWYAGNPGGWLDGVTKELFNKDGRDDFFMFVSNQGYLQSVYELMFIPRARELTSQAGPTFGFLDKNGNQNHSYNGGLRTQLSGTPHYSKMYRTYRNGTTDPEGNVLNASIGWGGPDDLSRLCISSGEKGMRVNPYTDMTNLFMGAIANMPMDWWAAGTNYNLTSKGYMNPDKSNFDQDYIFDNNILNYDNVYDISSFMMSEFKNNVRQDDPDYWKTIFEEWSWDGRVSGDDPLDTIKANITLNDRKFIYGYTRECFANRQQLFLVFLRAESVSLGGKSSGQLGARAVAVVWRDPRSASNVDNADIYLRSDNRDWRKDRKDGTRPHRTRVLFFHQFD